MIVNEARDDDGTLARKVSEQAEVMKDSITLYLDRARMAARVGAIGRVTDVAEVTEPLARALERINRDRGITISTDVQEGARFQGERHDLEEMLGNLLDNACKWARSKVFLTVRTVRPIALVYHVECVLLAAWCELRHGFRHFRADRIWACELLDAYFTGQSQALRSVWLEQNRFDGSDDTAAMGQKPAAATLSPSATTVP